MEYRIVSEREEGLESITRKGFHQSREVINALILLNCDERGSSMIIIAVEKTWQISCGSACARLTGSRSALLRRSWTAA